MYGQRDFAPLVLNERKIHDTLTQAGFTTGEHDNPDLQGFNKYNICNRGKKGEGVQLEISSGLRKKMYRSLKANDRNKTTPLFEDFILAVTKTLSN